MSDLNTFGTSQDEIVAREEARLFKAFSKPTRNPPIVKQTNLSKAPSKPTKQVDPNYKPSPKIDPGGVEISSIYSKELQRPKRSETAPKDPKPPKEPEKPSKQSTPTYGGVDDTSIYEQSNSRPPKKSANFISSVKQAPQRKDSKIDETSLFESQKPERKKKREDKNLRVEDSGPKSSNIDSSSIYDTGFGQ